MSLTMQIVALTYDKIKRQGVNSVNNVPEAFTFGTGRNKSRVRQLGQQRPRVSISKAEFYDPENEIITKVRLSGLTDEILPTLTYEQHTKIEAYVDSRELMLARRYATDGTSEFTEHLKL